MLVLGCVLVTCAFACEDFDDYSLSTNCLRTDNRVCDSGGGARGNGDSSSDAAPADGTDAPNDVSNDALDGSVSPKDGETSDVSERLGSTASLWNDGLPGHRAAIYVCFTTKPHVEKDGSRRCAKQQNPDQACNGESFDVGALRSRVRNAVEDSWQRYGGLEFIQWNDCPNSNSETAQTPGTIQVTFVSSCPKDQRDGLGNCLQADFDPPPWNELRGPGGRGGRPTDVHIDWRTLKPDGTGDRGVVHLFGHALGFGHSKGSGSGAACFPENVDYRDPNPLSLGEFFPSLDTESIMTPCPSALRARAEVFSAGDVLGLQSWYGRKPFGSLVGDNGQCLSVAQGTTNPPPGDGPVIAFPCRGARNDTWQKDEGSERLKLQSERGCLAATGADSKVNKTTCAEVETDAGGAVEDENQRFASTRVEWRAMGNLCVQAASDGSLRTAVCNGAESQRWDFFHDAANLGPGRIRASGSGQCVSRKTAPSVRYEALTLSDCAAADERQHFQPSRGHLLAVGTNEALGIFVGDTTPLVGSRLLLDFLDDMAFSNSEFYLSGSLQVRGQCLGFLSEDPPPGAPVQHQSCGVPAPLRQVWDYYFGPE